MHQFIFPPDSPVTRLDKFLSTNLPDRARHQIAQDIVAGRVTIDGAVNPQPSQRLRPGNVITYDPSIIPTLHLQPENIPLTVVYEDDDLLVLDKPAGLVVHPAPGHLTGTLANALLHHVGPKLEGVGGAGRWGIVHRLDANTSGLMTAAKSQPAYEKLVAMLAEHDVRRHYLGLTLGHFAENQGSIDRPIARRRSDRLRMGTIDPRRAIRYNIEGKTARTDWQLLIQGEGAALIGLTLHTGRTHQIRVHLQSIGRPIVGDPEYGWTLARTLHFLPPATRAPLSAIWPGRQMLHAAKLTFVHPLDPTKTLTHTSPPPADMQKVMSLFWPPEDINTRIAAWHIDTETIPVETPTQSPEDAI